MRRMKLVLAALAVMVMAFVAMSGTAVASDREDWNGNWNGNWNNCWQWNCNGNWNNNGWNTSWNNPWWWNNNFNNNFNNCLFLPALTIC